MGLRGRPDDVHFRKKTVRDFDYQGKRVLVRCDFNVPLEGGTITDDRRISEAMPTIRHLIDRGAAVILCSHLGRPKGVTPALTLKPVADRLTDLLDRPVPLLPDCIGSEVERACMALKPAEVVLLENVRFHPEEEANDPAFAGQLAALANLYVNDAFGTAHRAHASTEGVAHKIPGAMGFLIEKELRYLGQALTDPVRPFVAVLGGAKVKDKIEVIESLLPKVDQLLIGGGMAFTFLKALGMPIGKSLLDESNLGFAERIMDETNKIVLPHDVVVCKELTPTAETRVVPVDAIGSDEIGADIGPETAAQFFSFVKSAGTVVWNGPMGKFEDEPYSKGTRAISADSALRLARYFGTSAAFWMNLQARHDLELAEDEAGREIEKRVRPFKAA